MVSQRAALLSTVAGNAGSLASDPAAEALRRAIEERDTAWMAALGRAHRLIAHRMTSVRRLRLAASR
ncbi:MAG: hypothetical protein EXR72_03985 [Myxococcales bacterium]|nr:hypothetical protein [Myxococcales bacterium]